MREMLSNLIITQQCFVAVIDQTGQEKISHRILCQLLQEQQQQQSTIKTLPLSPALKEASAINDFGLQCKYSENKCNILLPPLADYLCHRNLEHIVRFVHRLRLCEQVERIFLWITPQNIIHPRREYILAAFEYIADIVLNLETANTLSIVTRKSGGGVTNKRYTYTKNKNEFLVELQTNKQQNPAGTGKSSSPSGNTATTVPATFKIELNEEELVARNTLKLPYEKTSETKESSIIYTPDAADDFDEEDEEEDPDDDLCV